MSVKLRAHIRSNIIGYVALFFALSTGSAVALSGSNTVFSDDIVDNEVYSADVRNDTLAGGGLAAADLKPGSVGTSEVAADSLGAGDLAPSSVGSSEVVNNSLTGADVSEATLGEVPSALLGGTGRREFDPYCNPETSTFETCVATPYVTLAPARVLVTAAYTATASGSTPGEYAAGTCKLGTSSFGEISFTSRYHDLPVNTMSGFSLVGITDPLPAGTYSFGLDCNETWNSIAYRDEQIAAVALSPN